MSKQRPDPEKMANELAGASAFFRPATPAPAAQSPSVPADKPAPTTSDRGEGIPNRAARAQHHKTATAQQRNAAPPETEDVEILGEGFDINAPHDTKGSFLLTQAEYDALSDLKRPLGRQYGVQISLHDLARCSVNLLLDDLKQHGEQSFLHRHLQHKTQK